MTPTIAGFRAYLPEFARLEDAQIQAHMDIIDSRVKSAWWGDLYLEAYYLTLADSLSATVRGINAKGTQPAAATVYRSRLDYLRMMLPKRGVVVHDANATRVQ